MPILEKITNCAILSSNKRKSPKNLILKSIFLTYYNVCYCMYALNALLILNYNFRATNNVETFLNKIYIIKG